MSAPAETKIHLLSGEIFTEYTPRIEIVQPEDFDQRAADKVLGILNSQARSSFILPTGSTPLGMYHILCSGPTNFTSFNLDEYLIDPLHPGSYKSFMKREYFDHLSVRPDWHIPNGAATDPYLEAQYYENSIRDFVEKNGLIDLAILGLGPSGSENMHIGFNEPGPDSDRGSVTRVINMSHETIAVNQEIFQAEIIKHDYLGSPRVPTQAITMGISTILDTPKEVLVLAKGQGKAAGVFNTLNGKIGCECPASYVRTHHNVTVLLDEAAASLLN